MIRVKIISVVWLIFNFTCGDLVSQSISVADQLKLMKGISCLEEKKSEFKQYFEIIIDQPVNHFGKTEKTFSQRIFLGLNNPEAPVVMETEGYAVNQVKKPDFIGDANYLVVEHRYYGKSIPDSLDWKFLTIKQATADLHKIRELLSTVFKNNKWLVTGISKGGQTALAYKMYYPNDADATLIFSTPVKKTINDLRLSLKLAALRKTEDGKKVFAFRNFGLNNKTALLKEFEIYAKEKGLSFLNLRQETALEYMLLEYPFAFFQNGFNPDLIPDTASTSPKEILAEIIAVVPPAFFSDQFRKKLEPSFYMFYHELGYYEYEIKDVQQWLPLKRYPNSVFLPEKNKIRFDKSYLHKLNKFIQSPDAKNLIFIYGENDPYSALQPDFTKNKSCLVLIVKNGSHKSRLNSLNAEQKKQVTDKLLLLMNRSFSE